MFKRKQKECWPKAFEVQASKIINSLWLQRLSRSNAEEEVTVGCWGAPSLSEALSAALRWGVQGEWWELPPPSRHPAQELIHAAAHLMLSTLRVLGSLLWTSFCLTLWLEWSVAGRGMCRMCLLCEFLPEGIHFACTQTGWRCEPKQSKWRWLRDCLENGEHFRQL